MTPTTHQPSALGYAPTPYVPVPQFVPPPTSSTQNFALNFGQMPPAQNFGTLPQPQNFGMPTNPQNFTSQQRSNFPQNYVPSQNYPSRDNFSGVPQNFTLPPQRETFPPSSQNYPPVPRDSYRDSNFPRDNSKGEFVSRDTYVPSRDNSYVAPPSTANLRTAAGSTAGLSRDEIEKKLCHFFTTAKGCRNAANCNFFHDPNARYDPNTNSMKLPR